MALNSLWSRLILSAVLCAISFSGLLTAALAQEGATLTVLRGEVAIVRTDGSAVQPAPSGSVVNTGDEIRTLTRAGALITFFAGTEIEMGADTILAVDTISKVGNRIDISLKQVAGVTLNRVQGLADTGSSYRINAGGAVALIRGTTFVLAGPTPTAAGNVVVLACQSDCSGASSLAGCGLQPFTAVGVVVDKGTVQSDCVTSGVDAAESPFDAAVQGITTVEHAVVGGNPGTTSLGAQAANGPQANSSKPQDSNTDSKNVPVIATATNSCSGLPAAPGASDVITFRLTWGAQPHDLDAHLSGPRPSAGRFHVYFGNTQFGEPFTSPFAILDRDDVDGNGPETISVSRDPVSGHFVPGEYRYWVHNYSGQFTADQSFAVSNACVVVGRGGTAIQSFSVQQAQGSTASPVWFVTRATLDSVGNLTLLPAELLVGGDSATVLCVSGDCAPTTLNTKGDGQRH